MKELDFNKKLTSEELKEHMKFIEQILSDKGEVKCLNCGCTFNIFFSTFKFCPSCREPRDKNK